MDLNTKAVEVVESYFEKPGIATLGVVRVDAFEPGIGWYPVTFDSLFSRDGFRAARAQGVETFAVSYGNRTADFQASELAPMAGLRG